MSTVAAVDRPKHALLLNSYHKGDGWTDEITRGVEETLIGKNVDLHVEYMDVKRKFDGEYLLLIADLLKKKNRNHRYDVIISSDNNALAFLKEQGEGLFGNTPVVFCGVNYLMADDIGNHSRFTGVTERVDFEANLALIRRLHPHRDKLLIVTDDTLSGKRIQEHVASLRSKWGKEFKEIKLLHDVTLADLGRKILALDQRTVVLYTSALKDSLGQFFEFDAGAQSVWDHALVPVYGTTNPSLGHGIVGGYLIDGYQHGVDAATQALELLAGTPVVDIPVRWISPVRLRFDYRQLQRFKIPLSVLPKKSEILYRPASFYRQHKRLVWNVVLVFGVMTMALVGLGYGLVRSRRAEQAQGRSEEKYRNLFATSEDAIFLIDTDQGFLDCNPAALKMFAVPSKDGFRLLSPADLSPEYQPDGHPSADLIGIANANIREQGSRSFEWLFRGVDGREFPATILVTRMEPGNRTIFQGTVRDITECKRTEEALRRRLEYQYGLGECIALLAELGDPGDNLSRVTEILRRAVGVSRAYIFMNEADPELGLCMTQVYESCGDGVIPQIDNPQMRHLPYSFGTVALLSDLQAGNPFARLVAELAEPERGLMMAQGVLSYLILPIHAGENLWGFIGFDDCESPRQWQEEDIQIIRSIAHAIGAALLRWEAVEALRVERAQLLSIFDSIDEVIYVTDTDTNEILYVNQALKKTLNTELIGQVCYKVFQGLDSPCDFCSNDIILKQKPEPHKWEYHNSTYDKTFAIVDRIIKWPDGRDVRFELAIDITERRRAEQSLKKSEERFDLAMSVANEGIWDWELESGKDLFDDRYYTMAGYEPGEFPGVLEEWEKRVHPDDIRNARDAVNMYLAGKIPAYETEFRFRKKDGTWMWILARGKVVSRGKDGNPIRFVGTHSDITELKHTEKALRRAQKMEAVGQLTGGIAHDFNNILGVVIGNLDLLKLQVGANPKASKRIGSARKAAIRAADLTKQLLGFSRSRAEHVAVTDINGVIQGMGNLIGRSLTPEVVVDYRFEEDLWLTGIDHGYFEDALLNLVLNARDAMPGGGRLTIETANRIISGDPGPSIFEAPPGEYVQLTVGDSGSGIPAEHLERIFEPFFTTKPQGKGTGLGLAMVFGFVEGSGGHIKAYSELGMGTRFRLYLPRTEGEALPLAPKPDVPVALPLGFETLLVVDDEAELLELARTTLEPLGYRVLTALDGHQALARLAEEPCVDLLFSDVLMPGGINGYELAEEACARYPHLKVLMTSGYTAKARATNAGTRFTSNLLSKPYAQADMVNRVRALLGENR
ncbi:MAG: PAS domain S-box protein [Desulfobacterium sp.]|nr:PAS domain S-box protein [Desulfobacterium sp.]